MADDAVRAQAAKILADVRAGTHSHGDIRDVGKLLDGKWDQDFPTALLEIASRTLNNSDDAVRTALKPCPFCGGDAELSNLVDADDYFVSCKNCEVQQIANYKAHDAVNRWNIRAHTLAGAGEVEKWLRNYAKQRNAQASLLNASDLIAAQRERIAELEKVLVPFAKNSDLAGNASDELIVGLLANGIADAITVRDLRRARAALGREG